MMRTPTTLFLHPLHDLVDVTECRAWSLCGLPALAFFGGYITVSTLGQPRVGAEHPKQAKLGGAICFGGMLLAWIGLVAVLQFMRG